MSGIDRDARAALTRDILRGVRQTADEQTRPLTAWELICAIHASDPGVRFTITKTGREALKGEDNG